MYVSLPSSSHPLILTSQEIRWLLNRSRLRHLQHRLSQLSALRWTRE